jgi:menaquinol-cytochrome c reductase iron-sulfur subunit
MSESSNQPGFARRLLTALRARLAPHEAGSAFARPASIAKEAPAPGVRASTDTASNPPAPGAIAATGATALSGERRTRTRREVLTLVSVAFGGVGAAIVAIPVIGALIAPLTRSTPATWRSVGKVSDFNIGTTQQVTFEESSPLAWSGVAAMTAAWLRRSGDQTFEAFAVNCTHLGCPVRWLPDASLFMCPCHGGVFYQDGSVAAGPPQRALFLYPVRVRDGQVEIETAPVPIV